jgi:uncharacterized protein YndB with AHSA1/START domain/uncharacterized protein YciI
MTLPPLRRQVLLACGQTEAYSRFVNEIGAWWPVAAFSCFGEGSSVALNGDRFIETSPTGETAIWGTIITAQPPRMVSFTWHPGQEPDQATEVSVTFTETGSDDTTLVTLQHAGWENTPDPAAARDEYAGGWTAVLAGYVNQLPQTAESPDLWLVLAHRPGPAAPEEGVFASPDFSKHVAFLQDLSSRGVLVAAGPLPDAPGSGMTVVHTTSFSQAQEVITAAQLADGSVSSGLLDVEVRPWQVVMSAAG